MLPLYLSVTSVVTGNVVLGTTVVGSVVVVVGGAVVVVAVACGGIYEYNSVSLPSASI